MTADYCDAYLDCEELEFDGGDCVETLDACTLEDGSKGIYHCDVVCKRLTPAGDATCDEAFDCLDAGYDGDDCEPPVPAMSDLTRLARDWRRPWTATEHARRRTTLVTVKYCDCLLRL